MKFQEGDLVCSTYASEFAYLQSLTQLRYDESRSLGIILEIARHSANEMDQPLYVVEWLSVGASGRIEQFCEQFLEKVDEQH